MAISFLIRLLITVNSMTHVIWLTTSHTDVFVCRRRYAYDAIHNTIAHSRIPLQTGGYGRVRVASLIYTVHDSFRLFNIRCAIRPKSPFVRF